MTYFPHQRAPGQRGFTLVETLVAITILSLAILAPFDAVERVINASRLAKDQLIASSLAQESLEFVRFIRTSNYLRDNTSATLMQGLDGSNSPAFGQHDCRRGSGTVCTLDATQPVVSAVGVCASGNCPLYVVTTGASAGAYTQSSNSGANAVTIFTRTFLYVPHAQYETVSVTITWEDHGSHKMILTENLYDWL